MDTNIPSLRNLQVNLAPLLPEKVLAALAAANITAEFHITPPGWKYPPTETSFRPFVAPLVEIRRRLSTTTAGGGGGGGDDFFLKYRWVRGGKTRGGVRVYRMRVGGVPSVEVEGGEDGGGGGGGVEGLRVEEEAGVLGAPLPPTRAVLHRYRTFHLDYSPCRH